MSSMWAVGRVVTMANVYSYWDTKPAPKIEGRKDDNNKLRYDLIPAHSLEAVADVYSKGAAKYGDKNYLRGINWSRVLAAMMRHIQAWRKGSTYDNEDGQHHLASVAWAALTLMEYERLRTEWDDLGSDLSEAWELITEYPGDYQVSSFGKIKNDRGKLLKPYTTSGYPKINLQSGGPETRKSFFVHRLVATYFLGPPEDDKWEVNHRDNDKTNCCVWNLEWCDGSGNRLRMYQSGRRERQAPQRKEKPCQNVGFTKTAPIS